MKNQYVDCVFLIQVESLLHNDLIIVIIVIFTQI